MRSPADNYNRNRSHLQAYIQVHPRLNNSAHVSNERCLSPGLGLGGAAADALGLRALQVRSRDPALIVLRAGGDSRAISANNSDLLGGIDLLRALGGLLSTLATLATALLLGEEGSDPGVVDEETGTSEGTKEDEVEEKTRQDISFRLIFDELPCVASRVDLHLRVEDAVGPLDNSDSLVVGGDGEDGVLRVSQDSDELKTEVLGVHLGREGVGHSLLCASRDLDRVLLRSKVAQNLELAIDLLEQRATDDVHANGLWLIVGDGQAGLSGMAIDELDAEDLRLGE